MQNTARYGVGLVPAFSCDPLSSPCCCGTARRTGTSPRHTHSGARAIFHTQRIPTLSQTRLESPPERGPGRQGVYTGSVHGVYARGPGACARIYIRGLWGGEGGSWGARCLARHPPGTAGPTLSPARYPRRPAEVALLPARHHPRLSRCLPGAVVWRAARRAARREPRTPAPSVPRGAGPAVPFE